MKLHCNIMGIVKPPSSCGVPGRSLLSTVPESALQSSGCSPEKNAKVSLNYLLEVTSGTFHGCSPTPHAPQGCCRRGGLSESLPAAQQMFALLPSIGCLMRNLLLSRWAGGPSRRPGL